MKPDFIKLDIEGAEYSALAGSVNTLIDSRPNIVIEATHKDDFNKINDFLSIYKYSPYVYVGKNLKKLFDFKPYSNVFFIIN